MPEKSINEISASWRELYEKGLIALKKDNLDYALTIFTKVLEKEPGFFECREALRVAQFKKAGAGRGFFRRSFQGLSVGPLLAKGQIALRSNPVEAMEVAEHILNSDPNSAMAHKLLAEAATAADFPKTAVLSWEIVRKNNPKDTGVALQLGQVLARAGMIARAESVYGDLLRADPGNLEIAQALKDLSARRTMAEGGYDSLSDGKGSYRDILRNKEEAVALEQEQREVKTEDVALNMIREYESRLEREPQNLKLLRSLAELHVQKGDLDGALAYYERLAKQTMGNDPSLDRAIAEIRLRQIDKAIASLDPQAGDHAAQVESLQAQRQEFQLSECRQRVERYPNDLAIRFEMGQLDYQAGRISEAIQEFQKSQANPHMRIPSLYHLGLCFSKRGLNDLAARTLQNALKEKVGFDDERKELIYALGCVFEAMGQREQAIEQFKQVYEVDIGYKDVAAKVDAFYAQQSSGT